MPRYGSMASKNNSYMMCNHKKHNTTVASQLMTAATVFIVSNLFSFYISFTSERFMIQHSPGNFFFCMYKKFPQSSKQNIKTTYIPFTWSKNRMYAYWCQWTMHDSYSLNISSKHTMYVYLCHIRGQHVIHTVPISFW